MLALPLLPLLFYVAFLTRLYFRQKPTVLNGSLDFTLLAWGLFGLISLGPGRLIIPLYVYAAWGVYTWIFWLGFYFAAVSVLARPLRNRLVVYHCQRELVLPPFFTLAQKIDPKTEWSGNVLSLHGLGIQWSVTCSKPWGYMLLAPTDPHVQSPHHEMLQAQLTTLCRSLVMPKRRIRWFWGTLTFGLLCLGFGLFFWELPGMVQQFHDCWLPG